MLTVTNAKPRRGDSARRCSRRASTRATFSLICPSAAPAGLHAIAGRRRARHRPSDLPAERQHALGLRHPAFRSGARPREAECAARGAGEPADDRRACAELHARGREARLDADGVPPERAADRPCRRHALPRPSLRADGAVAATGASTPRRSTGLSPVSTRMHRQRFSYANPGEPVEIVTLRVTATGRLPPRHGGADHASAPGGEGVCGAGFSLDGAWREIASLAPRRSCREPLAGPALIEEAYTTVFWPTAGPAAASEGGHLVRAAREAHRTRMRRSSHDPGTASRPIELEIIRNALTAAAAEMDVTVWRTSRSTIVRELLDYSTAIFDRDGCNVAQSARIPQPPQLDGQLPHRDLWRAHPGATSGGRTTSSSPTTPIAAASTCPTSSPSRPVFHDGRRIGFVGTLCHHLDVGGSSPGSYGSSAIEIFQEGLRIPPVKLFERGKLNEASARHHPAERAPAGHAVGRSAVAARLAGRSARPASSGSRRKLGEARFERACEQLARHLGGRHARGDRAHSRRHLRVRGLASTTTASPTSRSASMPGDRGPASEMTVDLSGCSPQAMGPSNATLASHVLRRVLRADGFGRRARRRPTPAATAPSRSSRRRAAA